MSRMLSVSFYRPMEYFSGTLNKFVTWMTDGEFCHCDLVIHTTPAEVMDVVKQIYTCLLYTSPSPRD